uniref:Uncharacterized protein n=1 Tax=Brassica oleracea TaxID=3712 RepID=A0A3P6E3T9_BRAOL|nr:unnamed protein product [Brassica oleracea]
MAKKKMKREFLGWMFTYVSVGLAGGETFDDWIRGDGRWTKLCCEVISDILYFRGYAFTTRKRRRSSTTYDARVCSHRDDKFYFFKKINIFYIPRKLIIFFTRSIDAFLDINPSIDLFTKKRSEYTEGPVPRNIPRNMSVGIFLSIYVYMSKNASIDERPRKYPDEVLPRYIPRTFPTN